MGHTAAALAATSAAILRMSTTDARSFSAQALSSATELYVLAAANEGLYSSNFIPNQKVTCTHGCMQFRNDASCALLYALLVMQRHAAGNAPVLVCPYCIGVCLRSYLIPLAIWTT